MVKTKFDFGLKTKKTKHLRGRILKSDILCNEIFSFNNGGSTAESSSAYQTRRLQKNIIF